MPSGGVAVLVVVARGVKHYVGGRILVDSYSRKVYRL